jgi:ElaB/YqjD/DUF883 family membrane-anchored ribosome-binding protein
MAPTTETAVRESTTLSDCIADAAQHAPHLSHEARLAKSIVKDAVEDGIHAARRALKSARRSVEQLEDYKDDAVHYVKRRPVKSAVIAATSGLAIGLVFGWVVGRRRRNARSVSERVEPNCSIDAVGPPRP